MNKKDFMRSVTPLLYGFILIEDRLAWSVDPGTFGKGSYEMAESAIDYASALWETMSNHGLLDEDNRSTDYTHLAAQYLP